jgi:hypothetical protein
MQRRLPHKKRRGKNMTKSKLLLVSLLLVFGLAAAVPGTCGAPPTGAGTQWTTYWSTNAILSGGHNETVGTITFTYTNFMSVDSYIVDGSHFDLVYNAAIVSSSVTLSCYGPTGICGYITPTVSGDSLRLTFSTAGSPGYTTFVAGGSWQINVTLNVDATTVPRAACGAVKVSITSTGVGANNPLVITPNESPYTVATIPNKKCSSLLDGLEVQR